MDILKETRVSSPLKTGNSFIMLVPGVYLVFQKEDSSVSMRFSDSAPQNDPEYADISFGNGALFTICQNGKAVLCCKSMDLGIDACGIVKTRSMQISANHKHVFGTGERFDHADQNGYASCGQVVEHFTRQGPWSYLPSPMFLTDGGFGFYHTGAENVKMEFKEEIRISSSVLHGKTDYFLLGTPDIQLKTYLSLSGECALPPEWTFGLWISANGWKNDRDVDEQLEMLKKHDCPASVMVLEAWSDESTFYRWSNQWPDPKNTVKRIRSAGLHLVLWQIPVIKAVSDCPDPEPVRRDLTEAMQKGYLIKHADDTPYVIPEKWFEGSFLIDFTNPEACRWWFEKRDHLLEAGVEGFKTDGGEFLFGSDFTLWDGTNGKEAHNLFPNQYISAYNEWMKKRNVNGVTFSRAGYGGVQNLPIHWAGDQLSTWPELRAQLTAGLSASLSGVLFFGFDIGGFAGEIPTAELYLRATALACFCPVMQWHAEPRSGQFFETNASEYINDRSPWNLAEKLHDPSVIDIACRFARIRESLRPYLWEEAQACVKNKRPMMAHLILDYPHDERAYVTHDEFMLGRKYLVAPITEEGAKGRRVYLPNGVWKHFFTGEIYPAGDHYIPCPIEQAIVFESV